MVVAYSEKEIQRQPDSVVTIGTFDGVHLGHRAIIHEMKSRAMRRKARSLAITFTPHPREVVGKGPVQYLSTVEERLEIFEQLDVDLTLVLKFTYEFSRLSPRTFYNDVVVRYIGVREVVVGHDHMFGRDREGGVEALEAIGKEAGFTTVTVPPVTVGGETVSSSAIREHLLRGEVGRAGELLGSPYSITGRVVEGSSRGEKLGFPTANIEPNQANKVVPALGVYCVRIDHGTDQFYGMMNVGVRPTFETDHRRVLEVHIFDFGENLYNQVLSVTFLRRLRPERKFSSQGELIAQLNNDKEECLKYLSELYQQKNF